MFRLKSIPAFVFFFAAATLLRGQCPTSNPVMVTNANNVGGGSLNWAIACVNNTPALTTIQFNISGASIISPTAAAPLPNITKANALIDGLTQPSGDLIIDGSVASSSANGLTIAASGGNVTIRGIHIRDFNSTAGGGTGIAINVGNNCDLTDNRLTNNRIGIATSTLITLLNISNNIIGVTASGGASGHSAQGINIGGAPTNGSITGNTIANSSGAGINVTGGTVFISNNSIYCNLGGGITRSGGPVAPVITSANTQRIRGTAAAGRVIEVFSHSITGCTAAPCQGKTLLGSVTTPGTGIWTLNLTTGQIPGGTPITATSTQNSNNTSIFSTCASASDCSALNANIAVNSNVNCFGGSTGSATASATGFSPLSAPTFLWNTNQTTTTISNLTANTYTVTVTDGVGCTNSETATITQPTPLTNNISTQNVLCFGGTSGSATANPSGGTPNTASGYTYKWNTGPTTQTLPNIPAGAYTVTVTDANGCTVTTSATITQPLALSATVSVQNVACFGGSNGSATANPSGGTPGYTYLWNNGQTTPTAINLAAGNYMVTITDENGCTVVRTASVTQPNALTATVSTQNVVCFGGSTGSANASATGGTPGGPGYSFLWSTGATTATISNLPANTYTVTVTDVAGCTDTQTGSVSQPPQLIAAMTTENAQCFGETTGGATASATGGTPGSTNYTFLWSNGSAGSSIFNVAAGTYTVTATDAVGCTDTQTGTVGQPLLLTVGISTQNIACFGGNTGTATATPTGGIPGYNYLWNNGQTTPTATSLTAGTYTVTVTDVNGCTAIRTTSLSQPTALNLNLSSTDETAVGAEDGTATAVASGGTPNLNYLWNTGATTFSIVNLPPGIYTVTVTDANGCTISDLTAVNSFNCAGLNLNVSSTNASCFGLANGTATATPSGSSGYTYLWNTGATTASISNLPSGVYTVTVSDAAGCTIVAGTNVSQPTALTLSVASTGETAVNANNGTATATASGGTPSWSYNWNTGATAMNLTGLAPGIYTVTVTDANDCTQSATASVAAFGCTGVSVSISQTNIACFGAADGTVTATSGGGSPTFTYLWNTGATTATIANLVAATYTVTMTDGAGCTAVNSATLTQPPALAVTVAHTDETAVNAKDGTATALASGGTPGFTYLWNTGATTINISSLVPGTYTVTATDTNGCTRTNSATVAPFGCTGVSVGISQTNIACFGAADGTAIATSGGGSPTFTYLWNTGATTATIANLIAATYTVTMTDAAGCTAVSSATLTQPPALAVTVAHTNETAVNAKDGTATALASGGTPGFTYLWNTGATTINISSLVPGTYTVTVTDTNGCTRTNSATVAPFGCTGVSVGVSQTNIACFGAADGTVTATSGGGSPNFTYLWNTGATTATIANLVAATYTVTMTDAAGCTAVNSATLTQRPALAVTVAKTNETLANAKDGTATAAVAGGTAPYGYFWNTGATTSGIANLAPGNYTVTITDANDCTTTRSVAVLAGTGGGGGCKALPVYAVMIPAKVCGNTEFILEVNDLYPNPAVLYVWMLPNGDTLVTPKTELDLVATSTAFSGNYFVLRDSAGCRSIAVGGAPLEVVSLAPGSIFAGKDTVICAAGVVVLKTSAPTTGTGAWVSLGVAKVDNPALPLSSARNLQTGPNRFVWKIDLPGCPGAAADTVTYFLEQKPIVNDDYYTLQRAHDVAVMEILLNDNLTGLTDTMLTLVDDVAIGQLEFLAEGRRFRYSVEEEGYRGTVTFRYAVCPPMPSICNLGCDTATVTIDILNLPNVPEGLILDDPGLNGKLTIRGVSGFSRVEITIFNRWGDLVFTEKDYDNAAPWQGKFNGKNLPEGAYYYFLKAYDGSKLVGGVLKGVVHLFDHSNLGQ